MAKIDAPVQTRETSGINNVGNVGAALLSNMRKPQINQEKLLDLHFVHGVLAHSCRGHDI